MKKISLILFAVCIAFVNIVSVSADADKVSFAYDYAGILNAETENYIEKKGESLLKKSGVNITVVTVDDDEINDLEKYFETLAGQYNIKKGIIILVAKNVGGIATYSTANMKKLISDDQLARIRENNVFGLKSGVFDFDRVILNLYRSVLVELNVNLSKTEIPLNAPRYAFSKFIYANLLVFAYCLFVIIMSELVVKKVYSDYKLRRKKK